MFACLGLLCASQVSGFVCFDLEIFVILSIAIIKRLLSLQLKTKFCKIIIHVCQLPHCISNLEQALALKQQVGLAVLNTFVHCCFELISLNVICEALSLLNNKQSGFFFYN